MDKQVVIIIITILVSVVGFFLSFMINHAVQHLKCLGEKIDGISDDTKDLSSEIKCIRNDIKNLPCKHADDGYGAVKPEKAVIHLNRPVGICPE